MFIYHNTHVRCYVACLKMYVRGFGIILLFIGSYNCEQKFKYTCNTFSMKDDEEKEGEQEIS